MAVWGGLTNSWKRREVESKGEKERCSHMNAEFQKIARRDKKAFLSDQCKERKTRDLFKTIRDTKGTFHAKMDTLVRTNFIRFQTIGNSCAKLIWSIPKFITMQQKNFTYNVSSLEYTKASFGFPQWLKQKRLHLPMQEVKRCEFDPWVRRSLVEGNGNPLQYSCLEIQWTEEPGGLQSMWSQRVRHDWATNSFTCSLWS